MRIRIRVNEAFKSNLCHQNKKSIDIGHWVIWHNMIGHSEYITHTRTAYYLYLPRQVWHTPAKAATTLSTLVCACVAAVRSASASLGHPKVCFSNPLYPKAYW